MWSQIYTQLVRGLTWKAVFSSVFSFSILPNLSPNCWYKDLIFMLLSFACVTSFLRFIFCDLISFISSVSLLLVSLTSVSSFLREDDSDSKDVAHFWRALTSPRATPSSLPSCLEDLIHSERSRFSQMISCSVTRGHNSQIFLIKFITQTIVWRRKKDR